MLKEIFSIFAKEWRAVYGFIVGLIFAVALSTTLIVALQQTDPLDIINDPVPTDKSAYVIGDAVEAQFNVLQRVDSPAKFTRALYCGSKVQALRPLEFPSRSLSTANELQFEFLTTVVEKTSITGDICWVSFTIQVDGEVVESFNTQTFSITPEEKGPGEGK